MASMCQDEVVVERSSSGGAIHGRGYHDWSGYREERVSGARVDAVTARLSRMPDSRRRRATALNRTQLLAAWASNRCPRGIVKSDSSPPQAVGGRILGRSWTILAQRG